MASICAIRYKSDRKDIVVNIPAEFNNAQASSCCIYKVPVNLREVNSGAYTPQLIAIGPIHHKDEKLQPMEREKDRYFQFFWSRYPHNAQKFFEDYKSKLEDKEQKIRLSYSVEFPEYRKEEFVEIILFDAVFIMELFLRFSPSKSDKDKNLGENDDIITKPWFQKSIFRDLILLENQIPMFVLTELYNTVVAVAADEKQKGSKFRDLAINYFNCLEICHHEESPSPKETNKPTLNCMPSCDQDRDSDTSDESKTFDENLEKSKHFTDMIRYFHLPNKLLSRKVKLGKCSVLKTATQLNEAGITFEKKDAQLNEAGVTFEKKDEHKECLLDIEFEKKPFWSYFLCLSCSPCFNCFKARFKVPQLKVDYSTECLLRNLIALEQCHYPNNPYICNYVSLIDSLIHTKDDVELLVEKEVISHNLGSHNELATMVNGLCKYVVADDTCYHQTIKDLNTHSEKIWNRSMAALRLVYFRDPWRASSTIVGIAVLVFTIFGFYRIIRLLW